MERKREKGKDGEKERLGKRWREREEKRWREREEAREEGEKTDRQTNT